MTINKKLLIQNAQVGLSSDVQKERQSEHRATLSDSTPYLHIDVCLGRVGYRSGKIMNAPTEHDPLERCCRPRNTHRGPSLPPRMDLRLQHVPGSARIPGFPC
jgi:hypothetical protein